jgi:hypothetical protein
MSQASSSASSAGSILWGANGHADQGGVYSNISLNQQSSDLHTVFGSGTTLYRNFADSWPASSSGPAVKTVQGLGIQPILNILTYPNWSSFANQAAAYNWAFSAATPFAQIPGVEYYEIGNEYPINGGFGKPAGDGSTAPDWSGVSQLPLAVAVTADAIAAIRHYNPKAKIIGGATNGWTYVGFCLALAQGLQADYPSVGLWDYTCVHWYNDVSGGNKMGLPSNFNGGMNVYSILKSIAKPLAFTEFGSSDGNNTANDSACGTALTNLMEDFYNNRTVSSTSPGVALACVYQLYQQPGSQTNYFLYYYSGGSTGREAPQGQAVQNWLKTHR